MNVKITLKPLDTYFFGGERNNGFGSDAPAPYFVRSEPLPSQTTLLGMLRYSVLKKAEKLTRDFAKGGAVSQGLLQPRAELIGSSSFSFGMQDGFGHIQALSPLFLEDAQGKLYCRCPINHDGNKAKYEPFGIESQAYQANGRQKVFLPESYDAKSGLYHGWCCVSPEDKQGFLVRDEDIFGQHEQVGIIKPDGPAKESGFFKKQYCYLKDGWRFVCFAQLAKTDDILSADIVRMGHGHSLFALRSEPNEIDFNAWCSRTFSSSNQPDDVLVYYALSDCRANCTADELYDLCRFAFTEKRFFRSLTTKNEAENFVQRMQKTQQQDLLRSGSVFYVAPAQKKMFLEKFKDSAAKKIGFNQLITIGGNEE